MKTKQLQKNIMRRVYYAYALRLAGHEMVVNGVLFGVALVVFARMVHVARVLEALQSLPVVSVPAYILNALSHGEVLTLMSMAIMTFALFRVGTYVARTAPYYQAHQLATR